MVKKNKKHSEEEGGEAWLLPYSDLMTLLLAVFIVLFAVSQVDETKTEKMAESFRESMIVGGGAGVFSGEGTSVIPMIPNQTGTGEGEQEGDGGTASEDAAQSEQTQSNVSQEELENFLGQYEMGNLQDLQLKLDKLFQGEGMNTAITTHIDTRGLVISLNNTILFESGSAVIKTENEDTLFQLAAAINSLDNYIRIEGHTDNRPINTKTYPSNWELSTARAASVVRLFIDKCNVAPEKVVAVGYGEYKPIADNDTEEGRAKNRRIDIIILSEKYNNLEDQSAQ